MTVVTADVGGSKISIAVTRGDLVLATGRGPGSAVRPGRALVTATAVIDLARDTLARANVLRADAVVVGAAGAGRAADAEEIRAAIARERLASRVIVVSDVVLAFEALGVEVGAVLVAGTGSVVVGRTGAGRLVRRGGFGWQMGDEGAGYWIGRAALRAAGRAVDGRGKATALIEQLQRAVGAPDFRELVAWSTLATPREVAHLTKAVAAAARAGDAVATEILEQAGQILAGLVNSLAPEFEAGAVPLGLTGGIVATEGLLGPRVASLIAPPFVPLERPLDPLVGGPRLAARADR
ncbi:MAG: ATPase [Gemmatimonadetes bacterium]|nr:ATPase [Gemmatimonadota bacterium]